MSPWLEEKGIVIYVNAYTDNTGTPMINEGLSYKRAEIIAKEINSSGFEEGSVVAKGWGEANPIETNDTEEGRYKNRRVEVIIRR
jgi:outer membrane protein OmpA-like peptidoglycan-associated protein